MITPTLNADGFTGHILIEPNRPISWKENVRFIKYFALISLIIALVAASQGLLLIMPFSGIEVMFVSGCLYIVFKHYSTCQIIYFTHNHVIIESGNHCAENRTKYQRYWSKFYVDDKGNYDIPRIRICSKGKKTEIGHFLNYKDKLVLIKLIKDLTVKFQAQ